MRLIILLKRFLPQGRTFVRCSHKALDWHITHHLSTQQVTIPDAMHYPWLEQPEATARVIDGFLRGL